MKKKMIPIILIIAIVAVIISVVLCYSNKFDLKINSQKIEEDEYLYIMNQKIYDVTQELTSANGKQVNKGFWEEEVNGVIPYEILADQTIDQLKYNRAVYENAKEQGYVDEIDYKHILERMEEENKSREEKIAAGEAVYGLSKFSEQLFMEYEMDTFQKQYCENLDNEGMQITKDEQKEYYEEYKEMLFVKNDDLILDYIKIDYAYRGMDEGKIKELENELIALYKNIDEEHSLRKLAEANNELSEYLVHEEILSSEMSAKAKIIGDIIEYAYELDKGDTTQVIDDNGTLYLIQCVDKVDYDYLPLEDVKDNINKELRERHYNDFIEKRAEESKVDGDMSNVYAFTKKHIKN